jgi:AAA domain-containing protein
LKRDHPAVPWRIANLQHTGHRDMLVAQWKAGKTTVISNLVRSLVDGDPFLGLYETTPVDGVVVLFDTEMEEHQLDEWHKCQGIRHDDQVIVISLKGALSTFNVLDKTVRSDWITRLKTICQAKCGRDPTYLILDCLRPLLDALGLKEGTDTGMFLTAFDAFLREAGIPEAVIVQHMGHDHERARGDSRLIDWPDATWTLARAKDDDGTDNPAAPRFFRAYGRDVNESEKQLAFDATTRRLAVVGGSRADARVNKMIAVVVEFIRAAKEPPSRNAIVDGLKADGHRERSVKTALAAGIK